MPKTPTQHKSRKGTPITFVLPPICLISPDEIMEQAGLRRQILDYIEELETRLPDLKTVYVQPNLDWTSVTVSETEPEPEPEPIMFLILIEDFEVHDQKKREGRRKPKKK